MEDGDAIDVGKELSDPCVLLFGRKFTNKLISSIFHPIATRDDSLPHLPSSFYLIYSYLQSRENTVAI